MRIAFCAPFYGAQAAGGAEMECRKTVHHLHDAGLSVEVFTTCLLDLQHDWNINVLPPGTRIEENIPVHRFPAEPIPKPVFAALNQRLMRGETLTENESRLFLSMNISSCRLLEALQREQHRFDWICFIPYLFGTTHQGLALCPGKSVLIPCLHDEGYARLPAMQALFQNAARIVFHTRSEQALAHQLYRYNPSSDRLIGEGITTHFPSDPERFRKKFGLFDSFLLCAGRKHSSKNTPQLVSYFHQHKIHRPDSPLRLVLIGPGTVPLPTGSAPFISDLGYLSEQDKRDAYSAATLFCQPSLNESFSIVLMEAWDCQTPALVNGNCTVLKEHALASGGALPYSSCAEFDASIAFLLAHPDTAAQMGRAGRHYVRSHFTWPRIVERYINEVFK